jgi:hypothetical protein
MREFTTIFDSAFPGASAAVKAVACIPDHELVPMVTDEDGEQPSSRKSFWQEFTLQRAMYISHLMN